MRPFSFLLSFGLLGAGLVGCSLSKAYPAKDYFVIEAAHPNPSAGAGNAILRVQTLDISETFSSKGLVSRVSDVSYESDYYAEFFTPPATMITESLASWLQDSGDYREVIGAASRLAPDWVLEGTVDALYGDLRAPDAPKAVLSFQVRLVDDRGPRSQVVFSKKYAATQSVASASPAALVRGWNQALATVLTEIERDLKSR